MEDFNKALKLEQNVWTYGERGILKRKIGDFRGALEDFNEASKIKEKDSFNLREKNLEDFERTYSIYPSLDWVKQNIRELGN